MKKLKLVLFSALTLGLALTSCGDDDSSSATSGKLEGKWIYAKEGGVVQGKEVLVDYEHTAGCDKDYMLISATEVKDVEFYNDGDGCKEDSYTSTYTRNGNTITVTEDGQANAGTIEKLTATELKISNTETFEGTTYKFVVTYTRG